MPTDRDLFISLTALILEREASPADMERFRALLRKHPGFIELYLRQTTVASLLSAVSLWQQGEVGDTGRYPARPRRGWWLGAAAAAAVALVLAGLGFWQWPGGVGGDLSQRHRDHGGGGERVKPGKQRSELSWISPRSGLEMEGEHPREPGMVDEPSRLIGERPREPLPVSGIAPQSPRRARSGEALAVELAAVAPLHRDPTDQTDPSDPTDHSRDPSAGAAAPAAERTISAAGTEPAAFAPKQPAALAPHKEEEADMTATQKLAAAISAAALTGATALQAAVPVVSNVEIEQISFTRRVRITYDLADADAIVTLAIETNGAAIPDACVTSVKGDVNRVVESGNGKTIEWNAGADWAEIICDDTQARVTAWSLDNPPQVVVVDLSAGSTAEAYPVAWYPSTDALPGGVTNSIYKNSNLVLKRIMAGFFTMGENPGISVNLTTDFYIGVYQLTQGQWYYVTGKWPAYFRDGTDKPYRPVEQVSYDNIRGVATNAPGYDWPSNGHAVAASSFMGTLRTRTGGMIEFDLPTEAQWEYACRAGTTTYYSDNISGTPNTTSNAQIDVLGRYASNGGQIYNEDKGEWENASKDSSADYGTAKVGSYLPNPWGLYDMHGNVYEWCLDWRAASLTGGSDPVGPESGENRVFRGGHWYLSASGCRSALRDAYIPSHSHYRYGFRVAAAAVVTP